MLLPGWRTMSQVMSRPMLAFWYLPFSLVALSDSNSKLMWLILLGMMGVPEKGCASVSISVFHMPPFYSHHPQEDQPHELRVGIRQGNQAEGQVPERQHGPRHHLGHCPPARQKHQGHHRQGRSDLHHRGHP